MSAVTPPPEQQEVQPVVPVQYVTAVSRPTNGFAIAGFVVSLLWGYGLLSVLGIIFSAIAMKQIKERNQGGNGLAIAGLVIGILGAIATLIIIIAAAAVSGGSSTTSY